MNKKIVAIILFALISQIGVFAVTDSNRVAVLYNKNTQVNRDALHFMGTQFTELGSIYEFEAIRDVSKIEPVVYKAILVLNTGRKSGMDPVLENFIETWKDRTRIILITLPKGSKNVQVDFIPSSINPMGVDAVSAASIWKKPGLGSIFGSKSEVMLMHEEWTSRVLDLIEEKN